MHAANAPLSSLHWNVDPVSLAVNEKAAVVWFVGFCGCAEIVVFGAFVSTVHVKLAGVESVLPAASVALISTVCEPSARPV